MFGGLLVAVTALATWWVAAGAGDAPTDRYVVANRLIGPGERITPDDVGLASGDLPPAVRKGAFTDPGEVVGAVALGPFDTGELVQAAALEAVPDRVARRELSFAVAAEWAVAGTLRPGDRIDVFTTLGEGIEATSHRVLAGAVVRAISSAGGDGLGETRDQTITVGVDDADLVAATVTATRSATVTVVRVTGTARDAEAAPGRSPTTTTPIPPTTERGGR